MIVTKRLGVPHAPAKRIEKTKIGGSGDRKGGQVDAAYMPDTTTRRARRQAVLFETMAYVIVWEFKVGAAHVAEFERVYGPAGDWVRLFRHGDGYLGTDLYRHGEQAGCYLTVDRWSSKAAFDAHHAKHQDAYDRIDERCQALTEGERLLGRYDEVEAPAAVPRSAAAPIRPLRTMTPRG